MFQVLDGERSGHTLLLLYMYYFDYIMFVLRVTFMSPHDKLKYRLKGNENLLRFQKIML